MLAVLGDLIDDVVVKLGGPIRHASDTEATVRHRRGGSAANVCAIAASLGVPSRLIAQVGTDSTGRALVDELSNGGVDTSAIRFAGATGTIVVLVDETGERTMLTDRRTALALGPYEERWLDDAAVLHVPLYSLARGEIAETAMAAIVDAHERGIEVSLDVSSVAEIGRLGAAATLDLIERLRPAVVFANIDEAVALSVGGPLGGTTTIVKRGPSPAIVHRPGMPSVEVAAIDAGPAADTTGAGDAFAAGFLASSGWADDPVAACRAGHAAAADLIRGRAIC